MQQKQTIDTMVSCPLCPDEEQDIHGRLSLLRTLCISVLFTMPLLWDLHPYIQLALASVIQFGPGRYFYRGAARSVRGKTLGMDFLVALSTSIIYIYSAATVFTVHTEIKLYFLCEGVLMSLILFGRYLETTSRSDASYAIRKLLCLQPLQATVIRNGREEAVAAEEITYGDAVKIRAGERIPVDGLIVDGLLLIDESMLTGESLQHRKSKGDKVYCGTLNCSGEATVRTQGLGKDTALQKIIDAVANAQNIKAPVARLADRIANIFVPCVVLIATGVFFLWYFALAPGNAEKGICCVCSILVIACPCALGLATPTGIMVGSGRAAELGVLFRDGAQIENAYKVDTVVFDKTGTLTFGSSEDMTEANLMRPGTAETVEELKKAGMEIYMISGDSKDNTLNVAYQCGIEKGHIFYGVNPTEKAELIEQLQKEKHRVAMVGDGINDAPALAQADVGIAMGNGTDIAIQAADIMIMSGNISGVPLALRLSRQTMHVIYLNLGWALIYNLICIPTAAAGIINPSIAAAAMSLSSNGVLFNSLRLKKMCAVSPKGETKHED